MLLFLMVCIRLCVCSGTETHPHAHECRCPQRPERSARPESQAVMPLPVWVLGSKKALCESSICSLDHHSVTRMLKYVPVISALYPVFRDCSEKQWRKVNAMCRTQIGTGDTLLSRSYLGWSIRVGSTKPRLVLSIHFP